MSDVQIQFPDPDSTLDPEEKNTEPTVDRAYVASEAHTFCGEKLTGWSGRRRAATFEIGFTGGGSVIDPIRVIYCCLVDNKTINSIFRGSVSATERFLQWAESNDCLDPSMERWQEAFTTAERILEEVEKSQFTDPSTTDTTANSPGSGN